jgi:hypothetical protein
LRSGFPVPAVFTMFAPFLSETEQSSTASMADVHGNAMSADYEP